MADPPKKVSPLWHYMRSMAPAPPPARPVGEDELPPREILEEDLEPLRRDLEWRPTMILEWFGSCQDDAEYLGRLLVGCGVIMGPHRLFELTERLRSMLIALLPRVRLMRNDDMFAARKTALDTLVKQLTSGSQELVQTRARAANDMESLPTKPDGLRMVDLLILVSNVHVALQAQEIAQRRNVTGVDFGLAVARQAPDLSRAETWLDKLMGNAALNGILLYWPPSYGRVVIVYEDGRLAYDPGAPVEDGV